MSAVLPLVWNPKLMTASGVVKTGFGRLDSVIATVASDLKVSLYDGTDNTGTKFIDSLPLSERQSQALPIEFKNGLYFEIVGGSGKVTVLYI